MKKSTIIAAIAITVVGAAYAQAQGLTPALRNYQQKLESLPQGKDAGSGLSPAEQQKLEQSSEQLREKTVDEAKTLAMGTGPTLSCLQDCSTKFDSCNRSATDWFQRYLCNIDATKCTIACVAK